VKIYVLLMTGVDGHF